ncbi:MAG TPA: hypothetical protein EYQ02_07045, partial [Microbacterium sp.]|nr:hypothetical protein [Microbacterium sp.]
MDSPPSVPGAQAIARAASLLRLVSAGGAAGLTVSELARRADLTRPTTHRLLTALRHRKIGVVNLGNIRHRGMLDGFSDLEKSEILEKHPTPS